MSQTRATPHYIGFDIGGTAIKYAVGTASKLVFHSQIPTPQGSLEEFLAAFHLLVQQIFEDFKHLELCGIGIATPGTIDFRSGLLKGVNPNLPWWVDIDPREVIPASYRHRAFCDNDANLMTLAEATGKEGGTIGITIGTGIGSGFVENDQIFRGSHGFALEAGHVSVVPDGAPCNCGLKGCVEAYASVTAICKAAARLNEDYAELPLSGLISASQQDIGLKDIIQNAERYLAIALANLCMILDPKQIILGGGAMDAGLYNLDAIRTQIKAHSQKAYHGVKVLKARFGNQAGMIGAIKYAARMSGGGSLKLRGLKC